MKASPPSAPAVTVAAPLPRRAFLGSLGTLAAATAIPSTPAVAAQPQEIAFQNLLRSLPKTRRGNALQVRIQAAQELLGGSPPVDHPVNADESLAGFPGNFSKALPHDAQGRVLPAAYAALRQACSTGAEADFAAVPLGGTVKLANPQAGWSYLMEGCDPFDLTMRAAPAFPSAETAGEMVECYWHAVLRDVPFADYISSSPVLDACADLSRLSDFRGPKFGTTVVPDTLFRASSSGNLTGPYISQFLFKPIPTGPVTYDQKYPVPAPGADFLTTEADWLAVQNGAPRSGPAVSGPVYLRNGRDLGEFVHKDYSYQAFLNAALILLAGGTRRNPGNPYLVKTAEAPFATFGGPHILDQVARIAVDALRAAWTQKWAFHRRLRPEEYAQRVHRRLTAGAAFPVHADVLSSPVLPQVWARQGSYLLAQGYAEGCPTHPAYPSGHATIAGACVTVLKAFFDSNAVISNPVVASRDGTALLPYTGPALTVGGELNKLAANMSIGRNFAGVHWRSDAIEGILLGEQVALEYLRCSDFLWNETFAGSALVTFGGTQVIV
jgi:membrane-associated phospholipid phosphatase